MPDRSRKKRPRDLNALAASVVRDATSEPEPVDPVREAARALASRGGKKGGPARAAKLTAEQRRESARKAAASRWRRSVQNP